MRLLHCKRDSVSLFKDCRILSSWERLLSQPPPQGLIIIMKRTPLAVVLLLSTGLVHGNCNNYGAGGMVCSDGVTQHTYTGGASIVTDNRGNSASINRYEGGYVSITPNTGVAPSGVAPSRDSSLNVGSRVIPYVDPFAR